MIFYLSCTGNTLWAAEELCRQMGEELVDMADSASYGRKWSFRSGERLGFCFPVHGWRPPKVVRRFVRQLRVEAEKDVFCYAVCTAGDTVGEAVDILKKDLLAVGLVLHSAYSLLMPNTYVGLPFMNVDSVETQNRKLRQASNDILRIERDIIDRRRGVFCITRGHWPRINSRFLGALFLKYLVTDTPFHVDRKRCMGCGKCVRVCPVNNLRLDDNRHPAWQHSEQCLACFACYHHCPLRAIQYGQRTHGKGQYFFRK